MPYECGVLDEKRMKSRTIKKRKSEESGEHYALMDTVNFMQSECTIGADFDAEQIDV